MPFVDAAELLAAVAVERLFTTDQENSLASRLEGNQYEIVYN